MTSRRPVPVALSLTLSLALAAGTLLGGCASDRERYCDAVREHQDELTEIAASSDPARLLDVLPVYRDLQERAPEDLREEWDEVVTAYDRLDRALTDAGLERSDLADFDPDDPPAGLDDADRDTIVDAAARLADPVTARALAGVEQQARDVCGTPLAR